MTVALAAVSATAQVQITVRKDGTKLISNMNSGGTRVSDYAWLAKQRNRHSKYDPIIERHCDKFGVDPILVRAVIQVESNFDPHSISRRGARGLAGSCWLISALLNSWVAPSASRLDASFGQEVRGELHAAADRRVVAFRLDERA